MSSPQVFCRIAWVDAHSALCCKSETFISIANLGEKLGERADDVCGCLWAPEVTLSSLSMYSGSFDNILTGEEKKAGSCGWHKFFWKFRFYSCAILLQFCIILWQYQPPELSCVSFAEC